MFTGIIETTGIVKEIITSGSNKTFWIESNLATELRIDQSLSHDGACLTVEEVNGRNYRVTAIEETLKKTNLAHWTAGTIVNLERCLRPDGRLDGHFVLGHVDTTGRLKKLKEKKGSTEMQFSFESGFSNLVVEKGSIAINGVSLTVFDVGKKNLKVAIIPYTLEHTNLRQIKPGDIVNLEFDMIGKYIARQLQR